MQDAALETENAAARRINTPSSLRTLGELEQTLDGDDSDTLRAGDDADSTAGDDVSSRKRGDEARGAPGNERDANRIASQGGHSFGSMLQLLRSATDKDPEGDTGGNRSDSVWRRWKRQLEKVKLPPWFKRHITFYRIHFTIYLTLITIGTLILYFSPSGPAGQASFVDCMYVATSALCVTGLLSISQGQMSTFNMVVVMFMFMIGSHIFTSLVPVFVRRYYFKKCLEREGIYELESMLNDTIVDNDDVANLGDLPELQESIRADSRTFSQNQGKGDITESTSFNDSLPMNNSRPLGPADITDPITSPSEGRSARYSSRRLRRPEAPDITPQALPGGDASGSDNLPFSTSGGQGRPHTSSNRPHGSSFRHLPLVGAALGTPGGPAASDVDDGGLDSVNNTWAGETAEMNARRLKKLLTMAKFQEKLEGQAGEAPSGAGGGTPFLRQISSKPALPTFPSSFFPFGAGGDDDEPPLRLDASVLPPGERRFLELRALELLSWLVPVYFFGLILLGSVWSFLCLRLNPYYMDILNQNGTNVVFMSVFQSASALVNCGITLFDANLVPFQAYFPFLLINMILILLGTTMYAPTLRFLLIIINKFGTPKQQLTTRYLLGHPRKCYTQLFPPPDTRWLIFTVVLFNAVEFFFFLVLDWNSTALDDLTTAVKLLVGAFQSVCTRNAGFNVIPLGALSPAMLVLYSALMLIAIYPVYITRQRSREQREVYDDQDLQIFYEDLEGGVMDKGVLAQGKRMVSRDSGILFIALFFVSVIQKNELEMDPQNYSIFNVFFEVMSAYTNVGLSLGYTCYENVDPCENVPYAFSGVWRTGTKLIIILLMILGRHRGLPDNIDAAIVIPDRKRFRRDLPRVPSGETQVSVTLPTPVANGTMPRRRPSFLHRSVSVAIKFQQDSSRQGNGASTISP